MKQIFLIAFFTFNILNLFCQMGALDKTFGVNGKVSNNFGGNAYCRSLTVQSSGKLIVSGYKDSAGINSLILQRYSANGVLDSAFGIGGTVVAGFSANFMANPTAIQSDDKIVVVGIFYNDYVVTRYTANGKIDSTFGTNGLVYTNFGGADNHVARAIAIQGDGKIVVAGTTNYNFSTGSLFEMVRYQKNGAYDSAFGTAGKVITDFSNDAETATALAIQSDGKIILAGYSRADGVNFDFAMARYSGNGTLDTTFGKGGKVTTDFSSDYEMAICMAIQADGKLVLAGQVSPMLPKYFIALARYADNGLLDSTFGTNGKVITDYGGSEIETARSVMILKDGKIVVAGFSKTGTNHDFILGRYQKNGKMDTTFGINGKVVFDFGGEDLAYGLVLQSDGKMVVAGSTGSGLKHNIALARFGNTPVSELKANVIRPFAIVPNPSNGVFTFQNNERLVIRSIKVYNLFGVSIASNSIVGSDPGNIDISWAPNGVYIVKIEAGEKCFVLKLVKE